MLLALLSLLPVLGRSSATVSDRSVPIDEQLSNGRYLLMGKQMLDSGNAERSIELLTLARERLPLLGDYALLWRAGARETQGDIDGAVADLEALRRDYRDSPLIKKARIREIELQRKRGSPAALPLLDRFTQDYPSHMEMKFAYARLLRETGDLQKAKSLFKDVYTSPTSFSKQAEAELAPPDITVSLLLKRGENLNKAWLFEESEKYFREALKKDTGTHRKEIKEGLALSMFRQKRYRESAELYRDVHKPYWRARSLLRANELAAFEAEMSHLYKSGDKKNAEVLISYAMKKRRQGEPEAALSVLDRVIAHFPGSKEDALWSKAWTYYALRDYRNASAVLSQMIEVYGDSRYHYWRDRCLDHLGDGAARKAEARRTNTRYRDFYSYLSALRDGRDFTAVARVTPDIPAGGGFSRRAEILSKLGFRSEAMEELQDPSRFAASPHDLLQASAFLKELGNYKQSINLISKTQYSSDIHDLLYPLGFRQDVEETAAMQGVDPFFVLSVIREESRFDPEARSIAGALGLMQLMPQTAQRFSKSGQVRLSRNSELFDVRTNIRIGTAYMKHLLKAYSSLPVALAAYNAGEEAVREWLRRGDYRTIDEFIEDIPYDETRNYVKRVMTTYFEYLRSIPGHSTEEIQKNVGIL